LTNVSFSESFFLACERSDFAPISCADVLSDKDMRRTYDAEGLDGVAREERAAQDGEAGAERRKSNASEAWEEFKPFKKETRRTKARDSAEAGASTAGGGGSSDAVGTAAPLAVGTVVE
jgi:DnaJ-class molecular chaperone